MIVLYTAIAVLCLLAITVIVAAYVCYFQTFYSSKKRRKSYYRLPRGDQYNAQREKLEALISETEALPYEKVCITSRDGLRLSGRYYHISDDAPLQIQFHGYRGTPTRDFCGGNKLARKCGHNTLMVDQRAHGESEGKTICFGAAERFDCLDWIDYAVKRFGDSRPIFLSGVSMGAATVLMASEFPMPDCVVGIIADCPYNSPEKIIKKVLRDMRLPAKLLYPFIKLGAIVFGGFNPDSADAVKAVRKSVKPIMIIHGEDDRFVPLQMSREIFEASNGNVTFHTFPHAGHALSYLTDPIKYEELIRKFISACLER